MKRKLDWQHEKIILDPKLTKGTIFHYFITPHHQTIIYVLRQEPNEVVAYQQNQTDQKDQKDQKKGNQNKEAWDLDLTRNEGLKKMREQLSTEEITNFTLFYDNKGDLCLILNTINATSEILEYNLYYCTSPDYGKNWVKYEQINPEFESWLIHHPPIILHTGYQAGNILIPIENSNTKRALTLLSENNGKTWNFSLHIELPEKDEDEDEEYNDSIQMSSPSVFETHDGLVKSFYWTNEMSTLNISRSKDRGITWKHEDVLEVSMKPNSPYRIIKMISNSNQVSPTLYILGIKPVENKFVVALWESNDSLEHFTVKYESAEHFPSSNIDLQVYLDFDENLHILIRSEDHPEAIAHFWKPYFDVTTNLD